MRLNINPNRSKSSDLFVYGRTFGRGHDLYIQTNSIIASRLSYLANDIKHDAIIGSRDRLVSNRHIFD